MKFEGDLAEETSKVSIDLKKFYAIFWNNIDYLTNPLNLLKISGSNNEAETDLEGRAIIDTSSKFSLIKSFFQAFKPLLEYFKSNPIDTAEDVTKRFPKYIRDPKLFTYQVQEPFFRKSVLVQLKFAYQIFTNQNLDKLNKLSAKDSFLPLTQSELQRIKKYDELVSFLLKRYKIGKPKHASSSGRKAKNINDAVNKALKNELHWADWKGLGCKPFSKSLDEDTKNKFWDTKGLVGKGVTQ